MGPSKFTRRLPLFGPKPSLSEEGLLQGIHYICTSAMEGDKGKDVPAGCLVIFPLGILVEQAKRS